MEPGLGRVADTSGTARQGGSPRSRRPVKVAYLMSRGLTREEAVSTITRGFLNVDLPGLPPALRESVDHLLSSSALDGL